MRKFLKVLLIICGLACLGMFGFEGYSLMIRGFSTHPDAFVPAIAQNANLNEADIQVTEEQHVGESIIVWFKTAADNVEWYAHFQKSLLLNQYQFMSTDYGTQPMAERFHILDSTGEYYVFPGHSQPPEFFFRGNPALKNRLILMFAWLFGSIAFLFVAFPMKIPVAPPRSAPPGTPKKKEKSAPESVQKKGVPPKRKLTLADLDDIDIENIDLDEYDLSDLDLDDLDDPS